MLVKPWRFGCERLTPFDNAVVGKNPATVKGHSSIEAISARSLSSGLCMTSCCREPQQKYPTWTGSATVRVRRDLITRSAQQGQSNSLRILCSRTREPYRLHAD